MKKFNKKLKDVDYSFNTLSKDDQDIVGKKYIDSKIDLLRKNINIGLMFKITKNVIFELFSPSEKIELIERFLVDTDFSFGEEKIKIPASLNLISEIIFDMDFVQAGLFRVNTTKQKIQTAISLLYDIIENRVDFNTGKQIFQKNFDMIDCCELYKELLRTFNTSIIPKAFLTALLKISEIENKEDKISCIKAIYYSLPATNRMILESNVFFCYQIVEATKNLETKAQQLDLNGLAIVMMPNLFLEEDRGVDIDKILILVDFTKFLYNNFKQIMVYDPSLLEQ